MPSVNDDDNEKFISNSVSLLVWKKRLCEKCFLGLWNILQFSLVDDRDKKLLVIGAKLLGKKLFFNKFLF